MKKTTRDTIIGVLHMICAGTFAVISGVELAHALDQLSQHHDHEATVWGVTALATLAFAHLAGENYRRIRRL